MTNTNAQEIEELAKDAQYLLQELSASLQLTDAGVYLTMDMAFQPVLLDASTHEELKEIAPEFMSSVILHPTYIQAVNLAKRASALLSMPQNKTFKRPR